MSDPASLCPVPEGALIADKYRVGTVMAAGGMGVVVEGRHEALEQRVAIKFLLPEAAKSPGAKERFVREARAAARIESEHVVRVFDVGMHEGSTPYMVMEFLEGGDLAAETTARGALPVSEAVDYLLEALEAIAEAHRMGIVHRDLKPSNLFLASRTDKSKRRRLKVLDFGISKVSTDALLSASLTSTRSLLGSPGYMSPEQVRNTKGVDARSDVWSIGVILFEIITGRTAYDGESLGDIFAKIREEPLPPIRTIRPEVPAGLEAVISKCLEHDRERRFADASALRQALLPFASTRSDGTIDAASAQASAVQPGETAKRSDGEPVTPAAGAGDSAESIVAGAATVNLRPIDHAGRAPNTISATSTTGAIPMTSPRRLLIGVAAAAAVAAVGLTFVLRSSTSEPVATPASKAPLPVATATVAPTAGALPNAAAEPAVPSPTAVDDTRPSAIVPAAGTASSAMAAPGTSGNARAPRKPAGAPKASSAASPGQPASPPTVGPKPAPTATAKKSNDLGI